MTTTRKIRLAALVAMANGVLFLSFGAPPCEAGKYCSQIACSWSIVPDYVSICQNECPKCGNFIFNSATIIITPKIPYYCAGYASEIICKCEKCTTPPCPYV